MLHDMGPEARQNAAQAAADMNRANSGLESMQSIDDALGNVEQDIMDRVGQRLGPDPTPRLHPRSADGAV